MDDTKREILNLVRNGSISPEEGAARLDALASGGDAAPAPVSTAPPPPAPGADKGVAQSVKVLSQFGSAEVVADPTVAVAVAEGPHRARVEGDILVIEHVPFQEEDTFTFGMAGRRVEINGFDFKTRRGLKVRMNPDLPLLASVQAGSLRVDGVHGAITAEVQAGSCTLNDFRAPIDITAQAGSINANGRLDSGQSRVRCEMGSVRLGLDKQSNVKITARATMGKITIDGTSGERAVPGGKEVTIGSGAGTLDIEGVMGSVRISVS